MSAISNDVEYTKLMEELYLDRTLPEGDVVEIITQLQDKINNDRVARGQTPFSQEIWNAIGQGAANTPVHETLVEQWSNLRNNIEHDRFLVNIGYDNGSTSSEVKSDIIALEMKLLDEERQNRDADAAPDDPLQQLIGVSEDTKRKANEVKEKLAELKSDVADVKQQQEDLGRAMEAQVSGDALDAVEIAQKSSKVATNAYSDASTVVDAMNETATPAMASQAVDEASASLNAAKSANDAALSAASANTSGTTSPSTEAAKKIATQFASESLKKAAAVTDLAKAATSQQESDSSDDEIDDDPSQQQQQQSPLQVPPPPSFAPLPILPITNYTKVSSRKRVRSHHSDEEESSASESSDNSSSGDESSDEE